MAIFGQLPSGFFQLKRCSYLLMFASITMFPLTTAPPRWTVKETRHLSLSGFRGLILSKTFESRSNPVPGVSSSLQMKMQIQPWLLPNSMYAEFPICWHQLFGSACEVRNTRHRDLAGNQWQSHELSLLLLLLF